METNKQTLLVHTSAIYSENALFCIKSTEDSQNDVLRDLLSNNSIDTTFIPDPMKLTLSLDVHRVWAKQLRIQWDYYSKILIEKNFTSPVLYDMNVNWWIAKMDCVYELTIGTREMPVQISKPEGETSGLPTTKLLLIGISQYKVS